MINPGETPPPPNAMNNFVLKIVRIVLIIVLAVGAAISAVAMSPFLLLRWWIWKQNERNAAKAVHAALAKRMQE